MIKVQQKVFHYYENPLGPKYFDDLSQTFAKQIVKISKRYLKWFLNKSRFIHIFFTPSAFLCPLRLQSRHKKAETLKKIWSHQLLFRNHLRYLFENFTICLAHVCNKFVKRIWSAQPMHQLHPFFCSNFEGGLAPRIMEIFSPTFFGVGCRPITVAPRQEFEIPLKNGVLKFLEWVINPEEIE